MLLAMSTVAELIDRIFREYLEPPTDQPAVLQIETAFTDGSDLTFVYVASFTDPRDLDALGQGVHLEMGDTLEVVQATAVNTTTRTVTCRRATLGTTLATTQAAALDMVKIAPDYTRQGVFDAIADAVATLYPDLWYEQAMPMMSETPWAIAPSDMLGSVSFVDTDGTGWPVRFEPKVAGGAAGGVIWSTIGAGVDGTLRYKARFERPADSTVELEEIGVLAHWEKVVMAMAIAQLLAGGDITRRVREYVTESIQFQGVPIGSGERIRNAAAQWARNELENAAMALVAEVGVEITYADNVWS